MPKKPTSERTTTVTERALERAARQGSLTAEEERVLRLRHGAGAPKDAPLERVGQAHPEARARLAEIELRAFQAMGQIYGLGQATAKPSKSKEKIIRALRRK
ncbi:MAG: hypothetical protein ACYCWW_06305 [Deltaproteobacteria bacterium]